MSRLDWNETRSRYSGSLKMELIIKEIAHKHGLDLSSLDDGLTLKIPDSARLPLMISKMGRHCISVAHCTDPIKLESKMATLWEW